LCEVNNKDIFEIKNALSELTKDFAVMSNNIERQSEIIDKLTISFERLSIVIERTDENTKKIDALNRRVEEVFSNGTKHCPTNFNRLDTMEKRLEKLNGYLIGVLIAIAMQLLAIFVYLVEKHLV